MTGNLVEIRNLRVEATTDAGRRVEIIKGVSLDIAEGEIVALIGESGSGKTTIAMTLMGYTRQGCTITGGEVRLAGVDMVKLSEPERARIRGTSVAYLPQSAAAAFNPALTVMDQVIEVARIHRLMSAAEARAKALSLFKALSLPEPETIGNRYPHQVSGGQLQRLAAAMALIGQPKVVIFDEPTTALDVTTQVEVLRAFKAVMVCLARSGRRRPDRRQHRRAQRRHGPGNGDDQQYPRGGLASLYEGTAGRVQTEDATARA
jgi:peptide/nickel transport system ATP-binding protein